MKKKNCGKIKGENQQIKKYKLMLGGLQHKMN